MLVATPSGVSWRRRAARTSPSPRRSSEWGSTDSRRSSQRTWTSWQRSCAGRFEDCSGPTARPCTSGCRRGPSTSRSGRWTRGLRRDLLAGGVLAGATGSGGRARDRLRGRRGAGGLASARRPHRGHFRSGAARRDVSGPPPRGLDSPPRPRAAAAAPARSAHVEHLLGALAPDAALVTVADAHPAALSWLGAVRGHRVYPLGVAHFGQSGDIPDLYRSTESTPRPSSARPRAPASSVG